MAFHKVIGQEKAARMLKNALAHRRLAHAYLFSGPDRVGQRHMAMELAKALNCTKRKDDACDTCTHCVRIAHGNFPDVHWIQPEGHAVKIDQIRALQENVSYHSMEASVKVLIIEAADMMTVQAANSLLKFLEEPVGDVVAVLLTENKHHVLPTVLSRCQTIPFQRVPSEIISRQLTAEGVAEREAAVAAKLAGSLEEARQIVREEWFRHALDVVVQVAKAVDGHIGQAMVVIQEKVVKSELGQHHLEYFLDLMILWYRDMLNISLGCEQPLTFLEHSEHFERQLTKWTEPRLVQAMEALMLAKRQLKQHVPSQLILEGWVLSVQEG